MVYVILLVVLYIACFYSWREYRYLVLEDRFFNGEEFASMKEMVQSYVKDFNDLNDYIKSLNEYVPKKNYKNLGYAVSSNQNKWNFRQAHLSKFSASLQVHNCSLTVLRNAQRSPFKYFCKYFDVPETEETIEEFEEMLNRFSSVSDGKKYLTKKKEDIYKSIQSYIPDFIICRAYDRLERELGFKPMKVSSIHFPSYRFQYVSPGGNKSDNVTLTFDRKNMEDFIYYLNEHVNWRNSKDGQRALMTSKLREEIKERDHYTCQLCGNSLECEPNLLLEIDHITPIAKGGKTEKPNLQTLCWKCNRSKGAKIANEQETD